MGVLVIRALLFEDYIRAPECWKPSYALPERLSHFHLASAPKPGMFLTACGMGLDKI